MGIAMSRVYVTLKVLAAQADQTKEILYNNHEWTDTWEKGKYTFFGFSDVSMGDLDFLDELQELGIAHNSKWNAGDEFGEGTEYCRFTPNGEVFQKTLYVADSSVPLESLVENLENHEMLKELILKKQAERHVEPLDARQIEYGKLHQVARLVIPEKELRKTS